LADRRIQPDRRSVSQVLMPMEAAIGHGSTAYWYLTRGSGLVSLVLLSATVVLGIVATLGWTSGAWPRFVSQSVHRNLSVLCLVFIAIHVVTTVADGYVPIGLLDAVIPFRTPYRTMWVGFGALSLDMLLAVAVTSGLRKHIGARAWRNTHLLAYLCWPIAVLHGLGSGSDARLPIVLAVEVLCIGSVFAASMWRLAVGPVPSTVGRMALALLGFAGVIGIAVFALVGPLRPGWSHRAGTSAALLGQLSGAASSTQPTVASPGGTSPSGPSSTTGMPTSLPTSGSLSGSYQTRSTATPGIEEVDLTMLVSGEANAPLIVQLVGPAVDGGVSMSSSRVTWSADTGVVSALTDSSMEASLSGPHGPVHLSLKLHLDRTDQSITGSFTSSTGDHT
jgi:sulfoxide reductase heme-binding subunit YedZ